jgi:hypothetical protein
LKQGQFFQIDQNPVSSTRNRVLKRAKSSQEPDSFRIGS